MSWKAIVAGMVAVVLIGLGAGGTITGYTRDTTVPPPALDRYDAKLIAQAWLRDRLDLIGATMTRADVGRYRRLSDTLYGMSVTVTLDTGQRFTYLVGESYGWHLSSNQPVSTPRRP